LRVLARRGRIVRKLCHLPLKGHTNRVQ
jgi:hypothetical protein